MFVFSLLAPPPRDLRRKWRRLMKHPQETQRPERRSSGPSVLSVTPLTKAQVTNKVRSDPSLFSLTCLLC